MKYVLLLRGINVGGRNKIVMADLRQAVAGLGYDNVETYINRIVAIFSLIQPRVEGTLLLIFKLFSQKDTPLWSNLLY